MNIMEPLVSIVIPVYNVEEYIYDALNSVLQQTYRNWEMILVDDGSTDRSGKICDEFAAAYNQVKVCHTSNRGPSHARNVGLENVIGEWVLFLDSDDYLVDNAIEILYRYSNSVDVVACGYETFPIIKKSSCVNKPETYINLKGIGQNIVSLFNNGSFFSGTCKLYRYKSIKNRFNENIFHAEDLVFNLEYMQHCNGICIIPNILYKYRKRYDFTLSKKLCMYNFEIYKRVWMTTQDVFGDVPEVKDFFGKYFAIQVSRFFLSISEIGSVPLTNKWLLIDSWLGDEIFTYPQIKCIYLDSDVFGTIWEACKLGNTNCVVDACIVCGNTERYTY